MCPARGAARAPGLVAGARARRRGDLDDAKKAKGITQKGITEAMKKKETPPPLSAILRRLMNEPEEIFRRVVSFVS